MSAPERKKVKLAHAEIGSVEGCQSKHNINLEHVEIQRVESCHSKHKESKKVNLAQAETQRVESCHSKHKESKKVKLAHAGIQRVEGCHSMRRKSGDLHSNTIKQKIPTKKQQLHSSNVDCAAGLRSSQYQGREMLGVKHDRTVNTGLRHRGQSVSGMKRDFEEVSLEHQFLSRKDSCSVYIPQFQSSIQNEQGAEVINLVSDEEDDVVYNQEEEEEEEEVIIQDTYYCQQEHKPQSSQQQQQQPVVQTLNEQQDSKVVIDEELQAAIHEARQLCREKHKNIAVDPQKVQMLATISGIANQMIQELGDNSVDVEALKEALFATKQLYKQGSNWYDEWTSAAQNYMVGQHEVAEAAQREAAALRTAMAESLVQQKLVCNMSLQELFVEFTNKSYLLKRIFNIVEETMILGIQTPELTDSCRKILELEKSCFKWYKFYEDTLKAYFDSLLNNKKLISIQRKMSNLDQRSPRTQRKHKIDCAKEFCNIFLEWHQVLSDSILEFEQNEDKQHPLPKVFHDFLVPLNYEAIEILD